MVLVRFQFELVGEVESYLFVPKLIKILALLLSFLTQSVSVMSLCIVLEKKVTSKWALNA